jgi:hypothetical protein
MAGWPAEVRSRVFLCALRGDRVLTTCDRAAGANLMGSDLYNNLIKYFVAHLKELKDVSKTGRMQHIGS